MWTYFCHYTTKREKIVSNRRSKECSRFIGDFETLATWTNIKVKLAGAGPGGSCYPDFKDFTTLEVRQHMYIYILNGLFPSPCLKMKFNTQAVNQINGNDFIATTLSQNPIGTRRHHAMFKAFLSILNPLIN